MISLALELASWFDVGLSWLASAVALVAIGFVATCGFVWAGQRLSESAGVALQRVEVVVREQRGTGVPALGTLLAGIGAALSGVFLSKWAGCAVAVVLAIITFGFDCLAQNSGAKSSLARWLFAFGAVLPFGVIVAVLSVTGGFGDVSAETAILGIGGTVLGALTVTSGLVAFWETRSAAQSTELGYGSGRSGSGPDETVFEPGSQGPA